jgi:hypothetical protein
MVWPWSPTPKPDDGSAKSPDDAPTPSFALTDEQKTRIFGQQYNHPSSGSTARETKADAELEAFLTSFSPTSTPATQSPTTTTQPQPQEPRPRATHATHDPLLPDGTPNIHPHALYPTSMSCRQAFDQAFYCQSLGGKFHDLYRYGHVKDCSEQWGAFWFCMRTKNLDEETRAREIREYYRKRDERHRKAVGGSSEDVWEIRTRPVMEAFGRDPDAVEEAVIRQ